MGCIDSKQLKNKHILLDTCFIVRAYQNDKGESLDKLFSLFQEAKATPVINEFIRFEFFRGCKNKEHKLLKEDLLKRTSVDCSLNSTPDVFEIATNISNIYSNKNIDSKQINVVDCLLSAFLQKYGNNIILLTENHKDFPLLLHKRIGTYVLDENEIAVLGFYTFLQDKYSLFLKDIC